MNAIPLLVVQSKKSAAVEINGTFIGEIGESVGAISLPVSHTGDVYVSVLPLGGERGAQLFSVTRKLVFKRGELIIPDSTDGMRIIRWPGGVFALEIEPGTLTPRPLYSFPFTIGTFDWLGARATLFYENGLHLLIEDKDEKLLLGHTIATDARNGILFSRRANGESLLFVHINETKGERLVCVKRTKGRFAVAFEHYAEGFTVADDGCVNCLKRLNTRLAHEQRSVYEFDGSEFVLVSTEPAVRVLRPETREDVVISFIEAVKNRFEAEAAGYLTEELALSVGFSDIAEFMGEFEGWARPLYGMPVEENSVFLGICNKASDNLFDARMFKFELDEASPPKIENFKEL